LWFVRNRLATEPLPGPFRLLRVEVAPYNTIAALNLVAPQPGVSIPQARAKRQGKALTADPGWPRAVVVAAIR